MKKIINSIIAVLLLVVLVTSTTVYAGNKDRSGEAGASELLINPWARSAGWGGANVANCFGLESLYSNIAGLAFTNNTELSFNHTQWLKGSGIGIINAGLAKKVGEGGVLGLSVMSMTFGDIPVTTTDLPEGGIGNFSPTYMNINVAYSKAFSNSIYGGINVKIISEQISDVSAAGIAVDAGIQYVTGDKENIRFGIALKNVGPTMSFSGDGLSIRSFLPGQDNKFTLEHRSAEFELPTHLNIGAAYIFHLPSENKFTLAGTFISNAFFKDQYILGAEFDLKSYLQLRAGYTYEDGILSDTERTTALTGPSGGLSVQIPMNKEKKSTFALDYAYRTTDPFQGTHSIGVRLTF